MVGNGSRPVSLLLPRGQREIAVNLLHRCTRKREWCCKKNHTHGGNK